MKYIDINKLLNTNKKAKKAICFAGGLIFAVGYVGSNHWLAAGASLLCFCLVSVFSEDEEPAKKPEVVKEYKPKVVKIDYESK